MKVSRPRIFQHADFTRLLYGQSISSLGDWMATIAFMAIVHELTGSTAAVGVVLVLRLAPGAVAAPLAGRAARRFGRKRTMLAMDLLRAGMAAAVPLSLSLWWLYMWAFLIEVASLLFLPARDSSIPDLIDRDEIPLANSLILALSYGMIPIGAGAFALASAFGIGGGEFAQKIVGPVFWADAATFLASYFFIRRIQSLPSEEALTDDGSGKPHRGGFLEAFRIPLVRGVMLPMAAITLALGALFSLGIALVREVLDASNAEFGLLIVLFGVGGAIGMALLQARGEECRIDDLKRGVGALGVMIFVTVLAPIQALAFLGALGFGAAASYSLAGGMSIVQERLVGEERVLAFTTFHVLVRTGLGVGAVVAGVAGDILGRTMLPGIGQAHPARVVLSVSGLIVLAASLFVHDPDAPRQPAERERTSET